MPVYGPWYGPWYLFPIIGLVLMVVMLFLVFGPRGPFAYFSGRREWGGPSDHDPRQENALDILKRRYAGGEITREQFEQMRRDVER